VKLWPLTLGIFLLAGTCAADTIYLKSGISLHADSVSESDDTLTYTVGATRYSLPKSSVAKVDHASTSLGVTVVAPRSGTLLPAPKTADSSAPPTAAVAATPRNKSQRQKLSAPPPPDDRNDDPEIARILNLGEVDEQVLTSIERAGDADKTAAAYYAACRHEMNHVRLVSARKYADRAEHFQPDTVISHTYYAVLSTAQQLYPEALAEAKRALALSPDSTYLMALLGSCYYNADDLINAVAMWKRVLAVHDSEQLRALKERVERQIEVESDFNEQASSHFSLRYEGREIGNALKADLLRTLEDCYRELSRDLNYTPTADIAVMLYSEKVFFDVTRAPSWAGAIYDGKLRIPVAGVKEVTPQIRAILKHELTHSFIHAMTHGNCPGWLNEGMAQLMEPRSSAPFRSRLATMFRDGRHAPLHDL